MDNMNRKAIKNELIQHEMMFHYPVAEVKKGWLEDPLSPRHISQRINSSCDFHFLANQTKCWG